VPDLAANEQTNSRTNNVIE